MGLVKTVAIVGQGYVGLPLAMAACKVGHKVIGIEASEKIALSLNEGLSHIEDVTHGELRDAINKHGYRVSVNGEDVSIADIVIICVPTPLNTNRDPDLSYIESALEKVAPHLSSNALLISESTSYPGTIRNHVKPIVENCRKDKGVGIRYAAAPERVDPLNSQWGMKATPRLVSGIGEEATALAYDFYSSFCDSVIKVSEPEVAESAKLLENTFRQVNIALVNQLVPFFHKLGVEAMEVIDAAATKPYGFMKFFPGAGVGGHCIPIDPLYLLWQSRQLGVDLPFIDSADKTNRDMPLYVSSRLIDQAGLQVGDQVLILGVAYKSGISDVRESPAIEVGKFFETKGLEVFWLDPTVKQFPVGKPWSGNENVRAAIVVTYQPGLPTEELVNKGISVLDCTGAYRGIVGIEQL